MNWLLKNLGIKDYAIVALVGMVCAFSQKLASDHAELAKAREVYQHPQIKYVDRIVEKQGPVRIVTRTVKQPSGVLIVDQTEERGEITTDTATSNESAPVPLNVALKEPRSDRYLLSAGLNRLTPDVDGKALFVGYGWKNRFDLQVGGVEHDGFSPWVLATLRF